MAGLRGRKAARAGVWFVALSVAAFVALPWASAGFASAIGPVRPGATASTSGFQASATWNGRSVDSASTVGTAFPYSFSSPATVQFHWFTTGPVPSGVGSISEAKLIVEFLSLPSYTKDELVTPPQPASAGQISMTYDLSADRYILQGLFLLQAALMNSNGSTVWAQNFYIHVTAPYELTVATVGLLAIFVLEIYLVVTVGPRAAEQARVKEYRAEQQRQREDSGADATTREVR
jgi:hypothetical protein